MREAAEACVNKNALDIRYRDINELLLKIQAYSDTMKTLVPKYQSPEEKLKDLVVMSQFLSGKLEKRKFLETGLTKAQSDLKILSEAHGITDDAVLDASIFQATNVLKSQASKLSNESQALGNALINSGNAFQLRVVSILNRSTDSRQISDTIKATIYRKHEYERFLHRLILTKHRLYENATSKEEPGLWEATHLNNKPTR